jgi:hypothetical protein
MSLLNESLVRTGISAGADSREPSFSSPAGADAADVAVGVTPVAGADVAGCVAMVAIAGRNNVAAAVRQRQNGQSDAQPP